MKRKKYLRIKPIAMDILVVLTFQRRILLKLSLNKFSVLL